MLGLYVHVPFCSAICNYCNFNRGLFDAALKARYVEALMLEIERAGERQGRSGQAARRHRRRRHDLLRRRDAVAARTRRNRPHHRRLPGGLRRRRRRRNHARGESRKRRPRRGSPDSARPASIASVSVSNPFASRAAAPLAAAHGRPRAGGGRRGARGRIRQRQPRPDDVAARAAGGRVARVGGRGDRARAGASVALPARGVSERAAQGRDGARALVAGARRRRGGDVSDGDGAARRRRVRAVRDLERRAARAAGRATT